MPFEDIVPGDIFVLNAGDGIPGDCLILESRDLFVDEATLTGETYPVEKPIKSAAGIPLSKRINSLFMGTHVVSGTAKAVVVKTGLDTEFGKISEHLRYKQPTTEFERGVKNFGYLLLEVTTVLIIRHLRHQRIFASAGAGIFHVRAGPGRRPDAPAATGDHQH